MAQQPIIIGTQDAKLGDTSFDAWTKAEANFTELYDSNGITGLVIVNTVDDLPAAVGGVRELVPNPGDSMVYLIAATTIDVGADRFTVTGGEVVIRGVHRTESGITSSTTGTMFTSVDSAFFQEFISLTCAAGQLVDFSNPSGGFKSFANQNLIVVDCDSLGTISGAFTSSFRTLTVISCQTSGFLWTGTTNSQINMSNSLALNWAGTLLDLGTATFSLISMSSNNRFLSPSGTVILGGATGSANLTPLGRALVESNIFNGVGAALSGINTLDLQWEFKGNIFADDITLNSRNLADIFLETLETVTINTIGIFEEVAGSDWSFTIDDRFTVSTSGVVTYIGLPNIEVKVDGFSTLAKVGGGADEIEPRLAKNWQPTDTSKTGDTNTDIIITNLSSVANLKAGVFISGTDIPADTTVVSVGVDSLVMSAAATGSSSTVSLTFHDKGIIHSGGTTENSAATSVPLNVLSTASTGDNFRMIVANNGSTSNIEVSRASAIIGGG